MYYRSVVNLMKLREIGWVGHAERVGENKRKACRAMLLTLKEKRSF